MHRILPIYLAIDSSASMSPKLPEVEQMLVDFVEELLSSPILGDHVRVGVVSFADTAELVLPLTDLTELHRIPRIPRGGGTRFPLTDLTDLHRMPRVPRGGGTRFSPLFELLHKVIGRDLAVQRAMDTEVLRPVLVLLSDGLPTDQGWERSFARFTRSTDATVILVTIGFGEGETQSLGRVLRATKSFSWADEQTYSLRTRMLGVLLEVTSYLTTSRAIPGISGLSGEQQMPERDG